MTEVILALAEAAALFLGMLALLSGAHKLMSQTRARRAVTNLTRISGAPASVLAAAAAAVELSAGLALLFPVSAAWGAGALVVLWFCYTALLLSAVIGGREIGDCGCDFGRRHAQPQGALPIMRNLSLMLIAGWVVVIAPDANPVSIIGGLPPALIFLGIYLAAESLAGVRLPSWRQS